MNERFERLARIEPVPGELGDDLLLRAIHAALMGHSIRTPDGRMEDYVRAAISHGLVRRDDVGSDNGYAMLRPTDLGALYWETRGAKFSDFIHQCPRVEDLAWQGTTDDAMRF